jgi:Flp pilus assembly protein TadG
MLVEAAILLPLLIMMAMGIIEFGRATAVSQSVTQAAREGARVAIRDGATNTQVASVVREYLQTTLALDPADVAVLITVTAADGNPNPNNEVANANSRDLCSVEVSVSFDNVGYAPGHFLKGRDLVGQCAMRHL